MTERGWVYEAMAGSRPTSRRSADTHLIRLSCRRVRASTLYLKDESTHPTGSLKHRLARSLFLYALCNGWIGPGTPRGRGLVGLDRGVGGLFRPAARAAVRRRHAAHAPRPRRSRRSSSTAGAATSSTTRATVYDAAGGSRPRPAATTWTSSPSPSGRPTGAATTTSPSRSSRSCGCERAPVPRWIVVRRRHRRHLGHHRPLHPLPPAADAALRGRSRALGFHRHYADRERRPRSRAVLLHRGHRPAARRALVRARRRRSDDQGARRGDLAAMRVLIERLGRRCGGSTGTNLWGCAAADRGDGGARRDRLGGHAAVRPRRALPGHLLRRRLARLARVRHRTGAGTSRAIPGRGAAA